MTHIDSEVIKNAVQMACRAPSLHNSQPWLWVALHGVDSRKPLGTCSSRPTFYLNPRQRPSSSALRRSISRIIIGVKMSCIARSILPPGHTSVFGRDMNESWSIASR